MFSSFPPPLTQFSTSCPFIFASLEIPAEFCPNKTPSEMPGLLQHIHLSYAQLHKSGNWKKHFYISAEFCPPIFWNEMMRHFHHFVCHSSALRISNSFLCTTSAGKSWNMESKNIGRRRVGPMGATTYLCLDFFLFTAYFGSRLYFEPNIKQKNTT